jgi:SAM-dependent methyltransferase
MDRLVKAEGKERLWQAAAWTRDRWVEAQARRLPAGARVLDAGAGASKYRPFFAHCRYETQDFCRYEGPLVHYAQAIDYVCDITTIPLPDASLDAILCTEVLEHIVDPMAALTEFARLLKPGGKLLLTAPQASCIHMEPFHYYGGFTEYWYRHWLPLRGFDVESIAFQAGSGEFTAQAAKTYYMAWFVWEKTLRGPQQWASFLLRNLTRIPLHFLPVRFLPRLDARLDKGQNCGLLVTAARLTQGNLV